MDLLTIEANGFCGEIDVDSIPQYINPKLDAKFDKGPQHVIDICRDIAKKGFDFSQRIEFGRFPHPKKKKEFIVVLYNGHTRFKCIQILNSLIGVPLSKYADKDDPKKIDMNEPGVRIKKPIKKISFVLNQFKSADEMLSSMYLTEKTREKSVLDYLTIIFDSGLTSKSRPKDIDLAINKTRPTTRKYVQFLTLFEATCEMQSISYETGLAQFRVWLERDGLKPSKRGETIDFMISNLIHFYDIYGWKLPNTYKKTYLAKPPKKAQKAEKFSGLAPEKAENPLDRIVKTNKIKPYKFGIKFRGFSHEVSFSARDIARIMEEQSLKYDEVIGRIEETKNQATFDFSNK